MEEFLDLWSRLAGGGFKPPAEALAEDRGLERRRKRRGWDRVRCGPGRWAMGRKALCRLKRRKLIRWHLNRGLVFALGWAWGLPVYCPGGVRRAGSMSPARALARNMWRRAPIPLLRKSAARGRPPSGGIREELSTVAGRAGGPARSSCEVPAYRSGDGAKGRGRPGWWMWSTV